MAKTSPINEQFADYIKLMKGLKSHATNVMICQYGYAALQSVMSGVRAYCYFGNKMDLDIFKYTYPEMTAFLQDSKDFKKTTSEVEWREDEEKKDSYINVKNKDNEFRLYIISSEEARREIIENLYRNIPGWETDAFLNDDDSLFTQLDESFIKGMIDKDLCTIKLPDTSIYVSKPFLGDLKKTEYVGYRIIYDDPDPNGTILLKFKQKESFGDIYTYAAFLKYM